jgi:hypothetical protein
MQHPEWPRERVEELWAKDSPPQARELVINDGFDSLDKMSAQAFFGGKAWQGLRDHLDAIRDDPRCGGDFQLEEWTVLAAQPRSYYLRVYLEFLFDNWPGCLDFAFAFVGALGQLSHMQAFGSLGERRCSVVRSVLAQMHEVAKFACDELTAWELRHAIEALQHKLALGACAAEPNAVFDCATLGT